MGLLLVTWAGGEFFLVEAATNKNAGKKPLERAFPHSSKCKRCHERAFEEWESSPLARSLHSASFRASLNRYLQTSQPQDRALCFRCHAPHILEYPEHFNHFLDEVKSRDPLIDGVGCAQCHLIQAVDDDVHPPLPRFSLGKTVFGSYEKAADNLAHQSQALPLFRSSQFCLSCHQALPSVKKTMDVPGWVGPWEKTKAKRKGQECQTCHMPAQFGESANGERNRKIANHTFPGRIGTLQQESATLTIETTVEGKQSHVKVIVQSLVPHNWPLPHPGWASVVLDLTVRGKNLRKVYGEQRVYTRVLADAAGKETVFDFEGVQVLRDTVLKPEETRVETFSFPTPKNAPSMDVIATLSYGPVRGTPEFLKSIEQESSQGKKDPAFKPIEIVKEKINIPLKK